MAVPKTTTNTVSKPYYDIPFLPLENEDQSSRHGAHFFRNVKQLQVGYGSQVFRVDRDGMWAGAETFADAPWKVYWDGRMEATDLVLGGYLAEGDAIGDVQTSIGAGGLSAITANIGTITAGSITGVTITGGTVQTSASGKRIVMTGDVMSIYNSAGALVGTFQGLAGTYASGIQVTVAEIDVMALADSGASSTVGATKDGLVVVDAGDLYLSTRKGDNTGGHVALKAGTSSQIVCFNDLRPSSDGGFNLGNSSFGWNRVYLGTLGRYLEDNSGTLYFNGSPVGNDGTVTSIATSGSITGGTITSTGTISHLTTAGHKHIPSGGASDQFLKYNASGEAVWSYLGGSEVSTLVPTLATANLGQASPLRLWNNAYIGSVRADNLRSLQQTYIIVNDDLISSSTGNDVGSSGNRFGTFYGVSVNTTGNAQIGGWTSTDSIFFNSTASNPSTNGQLLYFNSGGTEGLQVQFGGTDFQLDASFV